MRESTRAQSNRLTSSWFISPRVGATSTFLAEMAGSSVLCIMFKLISGGVGYLAEFARQAGLDPSFDFGLRIVDVTIISVACILGIVLLLNVVVRYASRLSVEDE